MKILKWLAGIVLLLAAVLLIGGWSMSPKFTVARSAGIDAPPEKVYALVADPRGWTSWGVWTRRDPAMQITYSGPPSGAGAAWAWKSDSEGSGKMSFTATDPGRRVAYELHFVDFDLVSQGELVFAPEGAGTRVTWTASGDMGSNPLMRWMTLFAGSMIGKDFDAGLANLKALAEAK